MPMIRRTLWTSAAVFVIASVLLTAGPQDRQRPAEKKTAAPAVKADPRLEALKKQAVADVDGMRDFSQQMVDQVFSYGELGFQEFETQKYLTGILEKEGFRIERGVAGIPTAWTARWGTGKPVIALGSDVDCIPQA